VRIQPEDALEGAVHDRALARCAWSARRARRRMVADELTDQAAMPVSERLSPAVGLRAPWLKNSITPVTSPYAVTGSDSAGGCSSRRRLRPRCDGVRADVGTHRGAVLQTLPGRPLANAQTRMRVGQRRSRPAACPADAEATRGPARRSRPPQRPSSQSTPRAKQPERRGAAGKRCASASVVTPGASDRRSCTKVVTALSVALGVASVAHQIPGSRQEAAALEFHPYARRRIGPLHVG